jgi:hypothetical protein
MWGAKAIWLTGPNGAVGHGQDLRYKLRVQRQRGFLLPAVDRHHLEPLGEAKVGPNGQAGGASKRLPPPPLRCDAHLDSAGVQATPEAPVSGQRIGIRVVWHCQGGILPNKRQHFDGPCLARRPAQQQRQRTPQAR